MNPSYLRMWLPMDDACRRFSEWIGLAPLGPPKKLKASKAVAAASHFFDFIPRLAQQIPRGVASELVPLLRAHGAGDAAHVIGGRDEIDGQDLPLEQAIDAALADPSGVVISCVPGQLALYIQEFPPGDTSILKYKP